MSSENNPLIAILPAGSSHGNYQTLTTESKIAIMALVVCAIAGSVIVALGAMHMFGHVGSIGFIASVAAGGGTLVCVCLGSVIWIVISHCKDQEQHPQLSIPEAFRVEVPPEEVALDLDSSTEDVPEIEVPVVFQQKENEERYEARRESFRAAAQARLEKQELPSCELPDCTAPEFQTNAEEAFDKFFHPMPPGSHIKTFGGGEHRCVTTDKIPGYLFKRRGIASRKEMTEYVERAERGRKICEENNLYLLYVPKCKMVDFNKSVVVEEQAELLDGGWESQKACYQWIVKDLQLQPYSKEIFRQLAVFICKMKLGDVKYDNISLTKDGRIALFDLDERSSLLGLTSGGARSNGGIFNMIPIEWFDEFIDIAKNHLSNEDFSELQKRLPKLKERALKREHGKLRKEEFYTKQQIVIPNQPLTFKKELFAKYTPEVLSFAEKAVQHINQEIATLPHLGMVIGRKIFIDTSMLSEFTVAIGLGNRFVYAGLQEIVKQGLLALQEQGYILSYKVRLHNRAFSVIC